MTQICVMCSFAVDERVDEMVHLRTDGSEVWVHAVKCLPLYNEELPAGTASWACPECGLRWFDGRRECQHRIEPSDRPVVEEPPQ